MQRMEKYKFMQVRPFYLYLFGYTVIHIFDFDYIDLTLTFIRLKWASVLIFVGLSFVNNLGITVAKSIFVA